MEVHSLWPQPAVLCIASNRPMVDPAPFMLCAHVAEDQDKQIFNQLQRMLASQAACRHILLIKRVQILIQAAEAVRKKCKEEEITLNGLIKGFRRPLRDTPADLLQLQQLFFFAAGFPPHQPQCGRPPRKNAPTRQSFCGKLQLRQKMLFLRVARIMLHGGTDALQISLEAVRNGILKICCFVVPGMNQQLVFVKCVF